MNDSFKTIFDPRNVRDKYKGVSEKLIKSDLRDHHQGFGVAVQNLAGDFNLSSVIRSANHFGANNIYYFGNKKYDKRGAVGTYIYSDVQYLPDYMTLLDVAVPPYMLVAVECNTQYPTTDLFHVDFEELEMPLFIFGEEGQGLDKEVLTNTDLIISIPNYGSVRSINTACAASIVMSHYLASKRKEGIGASGT